MPFANRQNALGSMPVSESRNPALDSFAAQIGSELVLAELLISRTANGFELRHLSDRSVSARELKRLALSDLRPLAQKTESGAFRPLKSAPNLQRGWRGAVAGVTELGVALSHLYPGAVADWYAAREAQPPVTGYREFTNRQSGMYRITQLLSDEQVALVIQSCCQPQFCLKRRLWSVEGLSADRAETKSIIPCLEPCALLLEAGRTALRNEQAEKGNLYSRKPKHPEALC